MPRDRWIQRAIKNPGALRRQLKGPLGRKIRAATKMPVFTKSGKINVKALQKFRKTQAYKRLSPTTKRRINLAITLRHLD